LSFLIGDSDAVEYLVDIIADQGDNRPLRKEAQKDSNCGSMAITRRCPQLAPAVFGVFFLYGDGFTNFLILSLDELGPGCLLMVSP